jgi:diacylglycerol kinase family enzyme
MVTLVVQRARARHQPLPRFGLLKLGTGNALAWVVGATDVGKRGRAADIERLHREAGSRSIRLVEVEDTLSPFAGLGADARVLADYNATKRWLGKTPLKPISAGLFSYGVSAITRTLPGYLLDKMPEVKITNGPKEAYKIDEDGDVERTFGPGELIYEGPSRITALATIPFYGFGLRMFPFADLRNDRMQLRLATISSFQFVTELSGIWNGTFRDPSAISDYLVDEITIECKEPTEFQVGGDPRGKRSALVARVAPETIQLVDFYSAQAAE